jgi:hypothetical protein
MNKLIYLFNGGDGNTSQYELETTRNKMNDSTISMKFYKNDLGWTNKVRGKKCATLHDHGNGINVTIGDKTISLEYDELVELEMLLKFLNEDSSIPLFTHTVQKLKEIDE